MGILIPGKRIFYAGSEIPGPRSGLKPITENDRCVLQMLYFVIAHPVARTSK